MMTGADTNILVRYLLQDDAHQSKLATQFMEQSSEEASIVINGIVLCELVWVLETAYEYHRKDIGKVLNQILQTKQFFISHSELVWQALHDYQNENIDFSDSYLGRMNLSLGCEYTVTFNKKASRMKYFKSLVSNH